MVGPPLGKDCAVAVISVKLVAYGLNRGVCELALSCWRPKGGGSVPQLAEADGKIRLAAAIVARAIWLGEKV